MKPAPFRYVRPGTVAEAVTLLADGDGEAKLLAGGQSLVPMLNMRLVRPAILVDLNTIPDLDRIEPTSEGGVAIGALARHADLLRIAAHRLEIDVADLELRDGAAVVRGAPDRRLALAELARTAYADVLGLPLGEELGLGARHAHQNPLAQPIDADRRVRSQLVFSNTAHCCLVEVDRRTGLVKMLKYVVVHDCGREMHPLIVEGMVHGSTVHGIGAALLEEFRYDETGQLLTSTFVDYLKPASADVPAIEVDRLEHPSPFTPLGAKGVGEGGAIPGPAAVANAVEDALAPFGAVIRSLPITPERVWRLMRPKETHA